MSVAHVEEGDQRNGMAGTPMCTCRSDEDGPSDSPISLFCSIDDLGEFAVGIEYGEIGIYLMQDNPPGAQHS